MAATIYFSGAITGGREDVGLYRRIIDALEAAGHRVLAGAVGAEHVGRNGESLDAAAIFLRDLAWVAESDVLVAEVSKPSLGVGYEIAAARYRYGVPVICLFRPAHVPRCSAMIAGDPDITTLFYRDDDVEEMVGRLLRLLPQSRE
ncbi:MAG TPA: nucleoside 2-deoxyribosyltransferase [Thermoanaerobaculia bacterium]|nr:nucleoside 2-deoxyribosyltransferase [Thermoanaerobaculia bacterium]